MDAFLDSVIQGTCGDSNLHDFCANVLVSSGHASRDDLIASVMNVLGELQESQNAVKCKLFYIVAAMFTTRPSEGSDAVLCSISFDTRLYTAMLMSEFATSSDDDLLTAVAACTSSVIRNTLSSTLAEPHADLPDSATLSTVLEQLESVRSLLANVLRAGECIGAKKSVVELHFAIAAFVAGRLHTLPDSLRAYAATMLSTCLQTLLSVTAKANVTPSLAGTALARLEYLLRNSGGQSGSLCSAVQELTRVLLMTLQQHLADPQRSSVCSTYAVSRHMRSVIAALLNTFPDVTKASRQALQHAADALTRDGGHTYVAGVTASSTSADTALSRSDNNDKVSIAEWNKKFARPAVPLLNGAAFDASGDMSATVLGIAGNTAGFADVPHSVGGSLLPGMDRDVTMEQLVHMVFLSLETAPIEIVYEPGFLERLHVEGIRASELAAAREMQKAEVQRIKLQEAMRIEEVPDAKLIYRTQGGGLAALSSAAHSLERASTRAQFQKRAFLSLVKSLRALRSSPAASHALTESQVRIAHGLVSRVLAQLPTSVSDSALDTLCELLEEEVQSEKTITVSRRPHSTFSLVLQFLFMKYMQLSPAAALQSVSGAVQSAASLEASLVFTPLDSVRVENPIQWLTTGKWEADGESASSRKRGREGGANDFGENDTGVVFATDTADDASPYSLILRRFLHVLVDANRADLVIELLQNCPCITTNIWAFLLQKLCLGERIHAPIGVYALGHLATKRRVYLAQTTSLLVFLSGSAKVDPRRLAVSQIGKLIETGVLTPVLEQFVVQYAMKLVARVPLIRTAKGEANGPHGVDSSISQAAADAVDRERSQILAAVDRQLALFLMLCSLKRHSKSLLQSLFRTYDECIRLGNTAVPRVLAQHSDMARLVQQFMKDPQGFVLNVLPTIRQHARSCSNLAQSFLLTAAVELRTQSAAAKASGDASAIEMYVNLAQILLTQARSMYEESALTETATPRAKPSSSTMPHGDVRDVRFLAPFFGLLERHELKSTGLVSLLRLASTEGFEETIVSQALKEALVRHPLADVIGAAAAPQQRGIGPVELVVFLHEAQQMNASAITVDMFLSILSVALKLSRTFELCPPAAVLMSSGIPLPPMLYEVKDCVKMLQQLLRQRPLPSLTMETAIACCRQHGPNAADIVFFVVSTILTQLSRDATWDSDPLLWRGAMEFCDEHWQETQGFLFNLPDRVLLSALKDHASMREHFRASQSTNASFSHILAAI